MSNYFYISDVAYKAFPELVVSKPIKISNDSVGYVAIIEDWQAIETHYEKIKPEGFFAHQCVDSQMSLTYDAVDYDEDDNEIDVVCDFTIDTCREYGFLEACDYELGVSKEENIAYVIFKLSEQSGLSPIEVINEIHS